MRTYVGRRERQREREREREGGGKERGRERETHVRATTMYFGAALHTPRGGQCPSLLWLKEGAEGREGWREQGGSGGRGRFAVEREAERQGGRAAGRSGKNEQTSSERWRGESCRGECAPARTLSSFPFFLSLLFFSLPLFSLSFSLVVTLSRLSFNFALRCTVGCSGGLLTARAISS